MNRLSILLRNHLGLVIILLVALFLLLPSLSMPWSLIDDGYSIQVSREFDQSLFSFNLSGAADTLFEPEIGRTRPVYYLYQWANYKIFGLSSTLHHLGRILLLLSTLSLIYLIVYQAIKDKLAGVLAGLFFLTFAPAFENWYRLGPVEPPLVVFLLLAFFFWLRADDLKKVLKDYFLTFLFLSLAILTKETAAVALLPLGFLSLFAKRKKEALGLILAIGLFTVVVRLISAFVSQGGYASFYEVSEERIGYSMSVFLNSFNFFKLTWLLAALFILFVGKTFLGRRKAGTRETWQATGLIWFASFFAIQLPWAFPLGRYLLPAAVGLAIFAGITIADALRIKGKLWLVSILIIFIWGLNLFYSLPSMVSTAGNLLARDQANGEVIKFLAMETPKDGRVLMNLSQEMDAIEWFEETKMHFREFYDREDIKVEYLKPEMLSEENQALVASWSQFQQLSTSDLEKRLPRQAKLVKSIREERRYLYANLTTVLKDFAAGRLFTRGIAPYLGSHDYEWKIYQI